MWSLLAVLVAAVIAGNMFITSFLASVDSKTQPTPQNVDPLGQKEWQQLEHRYRVISGMIALDQRAEVIWENIDKLQVEIEAYQKQFNELEVSEIGQRLIKDKWVVRYFLDRWGESIPHEKVAKFCRVRLNALTFTVREALAEERPPREKVAYEIHPDTWKAVDLIEFEVNEAKKSYVYHRGLVRALAAKVATGKPVTPTTLREAAEAMANEIALEKSGHPSSRKPNGSEGMLQRGSEDDPDLDDSGTGLDGSASLMRDVRHGRTNDGEIPTRAIMGRDTVRDRDEPPRRRLRP